MTEQLHDAAASGNLQLLKHLLENGADANARAADGSTPLMFAATFGQVEVVRALLAAGAAADAVDGRGWTALMMAVHNAELDRGFPEVVEALIDAGANIEVTIAYGIRPLMLAAGYGETAVVEVLLNAGADFRAQNDGGRTALAMVKEKHYVDVINLLHEIEQADGDEEAKGCGTKTSSSVIKFHKSERGH